MRPIFLEGGNIFLSPVSKDDNIEDYTQWINDQETTLFMWSGKFPQSIEAVKKYVDNYNNSNDGLLLGIFLKEPLKHIGNITLHEIDWKNRVAEIGIIIGDKKSRGKGYALKALNLVIEHAFGRLNLRRLYAGTVESNEASKKIFEKAGFKLEGTYREHFYLRGKYHNCLYFGLLKGEYSKDSE